MIKIMLKGLKARIAIIAILLGIACLSTYYFHVVLGIGTVFTHFFYIPIILAALWWKRKGLFVAIFLVAVLILSHIFNRPDVLTHNDLFRALMLMAVALTAVMLSERIAKIEKSLRQTGEYNRHLIESSPDFQMTLDKDGKIMDVNKAFEEVFGKSHKDMVGTYIYEYLPKEPIEKVIAEIFEKKKVKDIEITANMSGKGDLICNFSGTVFTTPEGELGIYTTGRDITARRKMEDEVKKSVEQLEQANIHLKEMDRLKSIFLASMSHELRTPLNSIIGFTGVMLMGMAGEINGEQRIQLSMVKNSANHLLSLINDLLDISKIEAGKIALSLEEFGLDSVLSEVVESVSSRVSVKGLQFSMEVPGGIMLFSDRRRIKQILLNLVSNAVKYTDWGSVSITARVSGDNNLEIHVIDTGIGIKQEDMNKLFQPFQQVDLSLTKKKEGTGLGLYLTRKLADVLGADISAKSEYGKGSEFTCIIPLRYEEKT